jgi:hypothetical protein
MRLVRRRHVAVAVLLASSLLASRVPAASESGHRAKKEKPATGKAKPVAEIVGEAEKVEGLMTFHRAPDKVWLELPASLVDAPLGFAAINVTAVGDFAMRGSDYDSQLVRWEKRGDSLVLAKQNMDFRADADPERAKVLARTFPSSLVFSAKMEKTSGDPAPILVDATTLFSETLARLVPPDGAFTLDPAKSILVSLKAFPDNVVARVSHRLERKEGAPASTSSQPGRLADARTAEILVDYNFFRLPEDGYQPRFADPRIGAFTREYKDYAGFDARDTLLRHVVERWDLRKKDPSAAVSDPVEPITFTMDRSIPPEWRPLVRDAALWWNPAFEKVGIRNAIRILDPPDDATWDPADVRHSIIYWNFSDNLNFSGVAGPSVSDPRTGKVLKANAWLNGEFLNYALHRFLVYSWWRAPTPGDDAGSLEAARDEAMRALRAEPGACDRAASFSSQMAFARLVLTARGILKPGAPEADTFAKQAFAELVAHEFGHALGFPHNWKASRLEKWDDIASNRVSGSGAHPITASVMDYNPIYLAPKGAAQGDYFMRSVGPYDELALEYIYKPLDNMTPAQQAAALDAIAARAEVTPGLAYDDGSTGDIDPTTSSDDLGDDSLAFSDARLTMLREEVLPRLPELVLAEGHDYPLLRQALDSAIFSVAMDYVDITARHVGGQVLMRRVAGSPASPAGGPAPITPIPAADQRRALDILERHVFADGAFALSPETMSQLEADQLPDWNYPWRYQSDYPLAARIAGLQDTALSTLLAPARLARILDNERRTAKGADRFTLPELFDRLERDAFRGVKGSPSADRRGFQRLVATRLEGLVLHPPAGTPAEATQLAAASLQHIARTCETSLSDRTHLDGYAVAHYEAIAARARQVLEAQFTIP